MVKCNHFAPISSSIDCQKLHWKIYKHDIFYRDRDYHLTTASLCRHLQMKRPDKVKKSQIQRHDSARLHCAIGTGNTRRAQY